MALVLLAFAPAAQSHGLLPSIADLTVVDGVFGFDVQANLECFFAGIDLLEVDDIGEAAEAATYDAVRAMEPDDLEQRFRAAQSRDCVEVCSERNKTVFYAFIYVGPEKGIAKRRTFT